MHAIRLHAGMTVGRYELLRPIGHGAMGSVYEAVHQSLGRRVALKVLHAPSADDAQTQRAADRFLREGRAAAQVRHAHVVDVYDFGVEGGLPFLVMELVDGESLAQLLRRETRMSAERAVEILLPILSAVAELHATGIVHRDIKPANILIARRGDCPKLADFGVSRFDDGSPSITQSGATIGTPEYMAPELMRARMPATERSDQYALGVTLYECITGERPFQGGTEYELMHAIVSARVRPPSDRQSSVPRALDEIVMRAMDRESEMRFAAVDELAEALLPFAPAWVSARWRTEFVPPGAQLEWEANASARRSAPARSELGARWQPRHARTVGTALGLTMLAALAIGIWILKAPSTGASSVAPPTGVPSAVASTASVPTVIAPTDTSAVAQIVSVVGVTPTSVGTSRSRSLPMTPPDRPSARAVASASPALDASSPIRGENGAPILEVP